MLNYWLILISDFAYFLSYDSLEEFKKNSFGTPIDIGTTEYEFPCDGYLIVYCVYGSGNYCYVSLNNINTAINVTSIATNGNGQTVFVKKGMTAKITEQINGSAKFYPLVD